MFLLYMPPGNPEAMVHYQDTIKNRVPLERLSRFLPSSLAARLRGTFGVSPIAVWGSQPGPKNRGNFERMSPGDDILIVEGERVRLVGKVAAKVVSAPLAHELWKPVGTAGDTTWELIYFIASPKELDVPFAEVRRLFGYEPNFQLRGFMSISEERLLRFREEYDDLQAILHRLHNGDEVRRKEAPLELVPPSEDLIPVPGEQIEQVLGDPNISEHVRMQWKLARLGLKAGEQVWVPVGDQQRLRRSYQFDQFDEEFAAGVDLPHSYIENIDVVWKREFRIGAAYEIENSTSIYSGLLRFADLTIVAPNTIYPMFVVAPQSRRNRLREQLRRPAFHRLGLDRKVRFLSYERIDEIDQFFEDSETGLTVETIVGKSELVA
ncbi:MAG: hypothetical protein NW201_02375 [Gemmatimonadales bacterium]|nr:hypothetical protein [Gemmatimonadales bacterium]